MEEGNSVVSLRCTPACGSEVAPAARLWTQGFALGWYIVAPLALGVVVG